MTKTAKENDSFSDFITNQKQNVGSTERIVSSIGGGALIAYGLKRRDTAGILLSLLGGSLALRGATGHCQLYDAMGIDTNNEQKYHGGGKTASSSKKGLLSGKIHVKQALTINKSPAELYQFWHNFENLPKFMAHLESVKTIGDKRSHWVAKAPLGMTVEWDAEITSDRENERIGWNSLEGSEIPNSGVVEFRPTSTRGTEVIVTLTYEPPAGKLGAFVAKLFGEEPKQQVYGDLYRFKSLMETGEIITVKGQTSGRAAKANKAKA